MLLFFFYFLIESDFLDARSYFLPANQNREARLATPEHHQSKFVWCHSRVYILPSKHSYWPVRVRILSWLFYKNEHNCAIYKRSRGVEPVNSHNNSSWWSQRDLGPVSRKSRILSRPEKPFEKLPTAYFGRPIFKRVFKVTKSKLTVKFDDLNPLRSWDTKGIVTPENGP